MGSYTDVRDEHQGQYYFHLPVTSTYPASPAMVQRFRPQYDSESEDDDLGSVLQNRKDESDDDFLSLSFGALSSAQKKLQQEERNRDEESLSSESDSEDEFF